MAKSASHGIIGFLLKILTLGFLILSIVLFVTGIKQVIKDVSQPVGWIVLTVSIIMFILSCVGFVVVLFFLGATEIKEEDQGSPKHTESQKIVAAHYARVENRVCPNCKAMCKVDDLFCPKCGAKLEE